MEYQFASTGVRRIAIGCEYTLGTTDGPNVIVRTPRTGYRVTRKRFTRTVIVQPPANNNGTVHNVVANSFIAGGLTQIGNVPGNLAIQGGSVQINEGDTSTRRVEILLPTGCNPDITSV